MFNDKPYIYLIGLIAQVFFFGRSMLQWVLSEKAKRVVSPVLFWKLSVIASVFLFAYGWLRHDFAVILGQTITFIVYIFNLNLVFKRQNISRNFWAIGYLFPVLLLFYMIVTADLSWHRFFQNEDISIPLLLWGTAGQIVFTLRFVYQGFYSKNVGESVLPLGFWVISLAGCWMIISYAIYRSDPVLILSQASGVIIYSRNIILSRQRVTVEA